MDDESTEKRSTSSRPRQRSDKPRGRGLGKPTQTVFRCSRCGHKESSSAIGPTSLCSSCGRDLHTCTNCAHFDTAAPNECRQPIPDPIPKKSRRNDCEYFSAKGVQEFEADAPSPEDARSEFDALFDF